MQYTRTVFALAVLALPGFANAADGPVVLEGKEGPGKGKHIVLISGDQEYRSEETIPQLAKILAERHGFKCTVLFTLDTDGTINPNVNNIPGLEALKSAAFYVGAIGSKKNNDARRERLKEFDLSADEIARLRGPVGLYIGSKTPPEIAVAILAEMTAVRHGVSEPSWAAKPERRFDPSACEVKAPT